MTLLLLLLPVDELPTSRLLLLRGLCHSPPSALATFPSALSGAPCAVAAGTFLIVKTTFSLSLFLFHRRSSSPLLPPPLTLEAVAAPGRYAERPSVGEIFSSLYLCFPVFLYSPGNGTSLSSTRGAFLFLPVAACLRAFLHSRSLICCGTLQLTSQVDHQPC